MSAKQRAKDASTQPAASDTASEIKPTEEQQSVVNAAVNLASYGVVLQVRHSDSELARVPRWPS
jgi:hypothetical protein